MTREMKKFLVRIVIFLSPFILLFGWIEIKARQLPNTYALKKQDIGTQLDSVNILVFGTSHAFDGIDPECFSCRGFNFANSSQSLFHDSRLCSMYSERTPALKGVIFTISYFSLWYEMQDLPENWRDYFYYHYWGIRHPSLSAADIKYWSYAALYPRSFLKKMILNTINRKEEFGDVRSNGWKSVTSSEEKSEISDSSGYKKVSFHNSIIRKEHLRANIGYLEEAAKQLSDRNIHIIFVIPPVFTTYSKYADTLIMEENRQILDALGAKYHALIFDYFSDKRFTREDFINDDHLNSGGAKKFSRILDSDFVAKVCRQ
jgi:hypothetical protein